MNRDTVSGAVSSDNDTYQGKQNDFSSPITLQAQDRIFDFSGRLDKEFKMVE
jgi:hypothetical protein